DTTIVDLDRLSAGSGQVVQRVFQVEGGEPAGIDDHHDPRPVNWDQAFQRAKADGLVGQDLVGGPAAAGLQRRAPLREVDFLGAQRVVGAVQVIDQKCERGRVDTHQAALDLGLAADLD